MSKLGEKYKKDIKATDLIYKCLWILIKEYAEWLRKDAY